MKNWNKILIKTSFVAMFAFAVFTANCSVAKATAGSGSSSVGGGNNTATGYFKDSNTAGLTYVSGGKTGVTGADGSFTYEPGQTVTFSVGGVTVGTSNGKSVVTPVDLVTAGSSTTAEVQNIVRFLMTLDSDGNPANGLTISPAVQTAAQTWAQPNFASTTAVFTADTNVTNAINSASAADVRGAVTLTTSGVAQTHLQDTLRCSYAGAYKGTYSGGDSGNFGVMVDASSGLITGYSFSNVSSATTPLNGNSAITYDQNASFASNLGAGTNFSGNYTSVDSLSGIWSVTVPAAASGNFSGSRIGGSLTAKYRFTGRYIATIGPTNSGMFSIDIDGANPNHATGVGYSVTNNQLSTISGTLTGTSFVGTDSNGTSILGTITTATGTITGGSWSNGAASGTFAGSGCTLN